MERVFNFSAGPSMLPLEVLEQAQKEFEMCIRDRVQNTTCGAYYDGRLFTKAFHLTLQSCGADDKGTTHINACVLCQQFRLTMHLRRQFMGRCQDDCLCSPYVGVDFLENGQQISKGFAGACFRSVSYTHLDVYKRQVLIRSE